VGRDSGGVAGNVRVSEAGMPFSWSGGSSPDFPTLGAASGRALEGGENGGELRKGSCRVGHGETGSFSGSKVGFFRI